MLTAAEYDFLCSSPVTSEIRAIQNNEKMRNATRIALLARIQAKTLLFSSILSRKVTDEPYRTICLELLDGVQPVAGHPTYGTLPNLMIDLPPIRLVAIRYQPDTQQFLAHPKGNVIAKRTKDVVMPGTDIITRVKVDAKLGPVATLSALEGRHCLQREGWPMAMQRSQGNRPGSIVEWEWLKADANRSVAPEASIQLYASCLDAFPELAEVVPPAPTTHRASAKATS
jgi:hypothetical protein